MASSRARGAGLLVAFALTLGVAREALAAKVTPWLEYTKSAPLIDIPHVFLSSPYVEIVRARIGGTWREVLKAEGNVGFHGLDPTVLDAGRSVLIRYGFDVLIFHEGSEEPSKLPWKTCPQPEVSQDRRNLLCFFAEDLSGDSEHSGVHVARVRMDRRDSKGVLVDSVTVLVPQNLADAFPYGGMLIGWTAKGIPVLDLEIFHHEDAAATTCIALALEEPLARELARRDVRFGCPRAAEWAKLIPGLVPRHRGL
jgi:hypothetical protein